MLPLALRINEVPVPAVDGSFKRNIDGSELLAASILFSLGIFEGFKSIVLSGNNLIIAFLSRGTTKNPAALKWLNYALDCCSKYDVHVTLFCGGINVTVNSPSRPAENEVFNKRFPESHNAPFPVRPYQRLPFAVTRVTKLGWELSRLRGKSLA